jgi:hypothetical protein
MGGAGRAEDRKSGKAEKQKLRRAEGERNGKQPLRGNLEPETCNLSTCNSYHSTWNFFLSTLDHFGAC